MRKIYNNSTYSFIEYKHSPMDVKRRDSNIFDSNTYVKIPDLKVLQSCFNEYGWGVFIQQQLKSSY